MCFVKQMLEGSMLLKSHHHSLISSTQGHRNCRRPQGPLPRKASLSFHLTRNTHRCGGATHPFIWCPTWRLFSRVKVRSSVVIEDKSTRHPEYVYSQPYGENQLPVWIPTRHLKFYNEPIRDAKKSTSVETETPQLSTVDSQDEQNSDKAEPPTWAQLKKLTQLATKCLENTKVTQTPRLLLAALMIVSTVVSLPMPAGAAAANYTYWAYVPFPPLIRAVTWMDNRIEVYVNDSVWVPGPTDDRCPAKPEEEGMMINISIGYRYPPICLGRAPGCLMPAVQNWLVEVPTVSPNSRFTYHMVSGMSLRPRVNYLQDFSYQRSLKFRPKGKPCPKEIPKGSKNTEALVWEECVANSVVILQNNEFGTIIDWAPRGQFYHNCSGQTQLCPSAQHWAGPTEEAHQRSPWGRPLRQFAVVTSQVLQPPDTSAFPSDKLKRLKRPEPAAASAHGRHVKLPVLSVDKQTVWIICLSVDAFPRPPPPVQATLALDLLVDVGGDFEAMEAALALALPAPGGNGEGFNVSMLEDKQKKNSQKGRRLRGSDSTRPAEREPGLSSLTNSQWGMQAPRQVPPSISSQEPGLTQRQRMSTGHNPFKGFPALAMASCTSHISSR
ncbi:uncharacterized protein LOC129031592 [Pongo pygmaeus]|uniref:uncharacterized protein LOC129031592 n=1 Tax=Pongo pygmaeus TaxID=9600 RepID=UPI00300C8DF3